MVAHYGNAGRRRYPGVVEVLSTILKLSSHGVDEACNGIKAVKRLQENCYNVVVTDAQITILTHDGGKL